jgi:hypothetical protein
VDDVQWLCWVVGVSLVCRANLRVWKAPDEPDWGKVIACNREVYGDCGHCDSKMIESAHPHHQLFSTPAASQVNMVSVVDC